ncbi:MAG TPA: ABC transporter permease [Gemmataceae bacterium]|nr:ABC transporter permease [Gemmataceae bacterium]
MTRLLGVLLMVLVLYAILMGFFEKARSLDNHQVLARRLGFYGVLTLGVGVLIVTGGIDLSIGSLVGLAAVAFGHLMNKHHWQPWPAATAVIAGSVFIGLFHGLLVTGLRLQPFLVTLCGLFMYRGLARKLSDIAVVLPYESVQPQAEWLRSFLVSGKTLGLPHVLILLGLLAALLALVLHGSVYGRYWYAIGYNEQAARYAGIATNRHKIAAYVISSTCAGLGGVLFLLEYRNATPSDAGSLLELYAITGAVLGGCSLRGGEGTIPGMILGAAVLPLLAQICNTSPYIGSQLEYTVIGGALLLATIANELVTRLSKRR